MVDRNNRGRKQRANYQSISKAIRQAAFEVPLDPQEVISPRLSHACTPVRTSKMSRNSACGNSRLVALKRLHSVLARIQTATVLVIFRVDVGADSIRIINQWERVALGGAWKTQVDVNIPRLAAYRSERDGIRKGELVRTKGIRDLPFVDKGALTRVGAAASRASFGNAPARRAVTGFFSSFRTERTLGGPRSFKVEETHETVLRHKRLSFGILSLPVL
jgi:hypothetical protein